MKKLILIVVALSFSLFGFSEGIEFENGSWKEVLEKAKQTHKPIFVDVYTSWCGPCKTMSNNIFPQAKVGRIYNSQFICYQVDAERGGDGFAIAKAYQVKAYPTYLFINPDGTLFYRALGARDEENFIGVARYALANFKRDPQPEQLSDAECTRRANDTIFLLDRLQKGPDDILFDQYLKLIPEKESASMTVTELYKKNGPYLNVYSFAYANLVKNLVVFKEKLSDYVYSYLLDGIMNSVNAAAKTKNKELLVSAMTIYKQLPEEAQYIHSFEIYMQYYKETREIDNYMKYANKFCNNYLMQLDPDSIDKIDKVNVQLFEKQINSGLFARIDSTQFDQLMTYLKLYEKEIQKYSWMGGDLKYKIFATNFGNKPFLKIYSDSITHGNQLIIPSNSGVHTLIDTKQTDQIREYLAHYERNKISGSLNDIAWETFKKVSDQKVLENALLWSKHSLEIYPNNPFYMETYASLLYKLDRKKEAIDKEKEALRYANKKNGNLYKMMENKLRKMKAGEITWLSVNDGN